MKKLFAIALLASVGALAQTMASNSAVMGAAAPRPLIGFYNGTLVGAVGMNHFSVSVDQQSGETLSGTATFYGGLRQCRGILPFSGAIQNGGIIVLNIGARTSGCERVMTVHQVADGRLVGTVPPQDGMRTVPWDIVLTRTQ